MIFVLTIINNVNNICKNENHWSLLITRYSLLISRYSLLTRNTNTRSIVPVMLESNIQLLVVYTNIQLAQEEKGTDFCINMDNNIV